MSRQDATPAMTEITQARAGNLHCELREWLSASATAFGAMHRTSRGAQRSEEGAQDQESCAASAHHPQESGSGQCGGRSGQSRRRLDGCCAEERKERKLSRSNKRVRGGRSDRPVVRGHERTQHAQASRRRSKRPDAPAAPGRLSACVLILRVCSAEFTSNSYAA